MTDPDLGGVDAQTFAKLVADTPEKQVRAVLADHVLRAKILTEVFGRMREHLREERAAEVRAVIHWRFTDGDGDDGYDRFETIIADGACRTTPDKTGKARVTITTHPYEFLRLITGNASAPVLFMTGRLKVRGDLAFAAGLMGLFEMPRA